VNPIRKFGKRDRPLKGKDWQRWCLDQKLKCIVYEVSENQNRSQGRTRKKDGTLRSMPWILLFIP
jgi:hypothetical protein